MLIACESCRQASNMSLRSNGSPMFAQFQERIGGPAIEPTSPHEGLELDASATHENEHLDEILGPVSHAYTSSTIIGAPTSCVSVGVANGVRGGMIGAGFGAVFAIASPPPMASSSTIAAHVGQAALRNAAGFASWTGVYGFSRCQLVKMRRTNDLMNPLLAGGFTGAVLSLATIPRGHWRYAQQTIAQNAGGSALIACVFDIANRI